MKIEMTSCGSCDDVIERLVTASLDDAWRVTGNATWLMISSAGLAQVRQGWKLHISSRAATFPDLVRTILPVLTAEGCAFKLARSQRVLAELNGGITAPASVGKAVTIYPDQGRVRELGVRLAELLDGWQGPRVLSDRQVRRVAPVYYRYGPFAAEWEYAPGGRLGLLLRGPAGEVADGAATLDYQQPPWAIDPFTGEQASGGGPVAGSQIAGEHYQITKGIRQAARGNVYAAVDLRDGTVVVVKQARALVGEDSAHADARLRLRNERRVLQVLDGVAGIPRFVDHFRHGADEFLVVSHCGPDNLAEDVLHHGTYRVEDAASSRSLGSLATALVRILSVLHERGVIMRDLSPKNVVIGEAGPSIVDFGIAACDCLYLAGATPGYAPARQHRGESPARADDYFALGLTLLFAATGLDPTYVDGDLELPRTRALQRISADYGTEPPPIIGLAADLMSDSEQVASQAFRSLASGEAGLRQARVRLWPAVPALTAELAAEVADNLLGDLLRHAEELLAIPPGERAGQDASIYDGSSGIGLELLSHLSAEHAGQILVGLAEFSARAAERAKLPPGLFAGATGVHIFLREASAAGVTVPAVAGCLPGPEWEPDGEDLLAGAAGVGLGHLRLSQYGEPAQLDLALRCGRAIIAGTVQAAKVVDGARAAAGADPSAGQAHGLAGVTGFLTALAARTGDELILAAAAERARQLAQRTEPLVDQVVQFTAAPLAVSWCYGLAGIGPVLLLASTVLQDESLGRLARHAAQACIGYLPRIAAPGRCCGAAGVGNFLIDLAVARQEERYWRAAERAGLQILLRSGGTPGHPVFPASFDRSQAGWAAGTAGILSFFRRLANRGGPDNIPLINGT